MKTPFRLGTKDRICCRSVVVELFEGLFKTSLFSVNVFFWLCALGSKADFIPVLIRFRLTVKLAVHATSSCIDAGFENVLRSVNVHQDVTRW